MNVTGGCARNANSVCGGHRLEHRRINRGLIGKEAGIGFAHRPMRAKDSARRFQMRIITLKMLEPCGRSHRMRLAGRAVAVFLTARQTSPHHLDPGGLLQDTQKSLRDSLTERGTAFNALPAPPLPPAARSLGVEPC